MEETFLFLNISIGTLFHVMQRIRIPILCIIKNSPPCKNTKLQFIFKTYKYNMIITINEKSIRLYCRYKKYRRYVYN